MVFIRKYLKKANQNVVIIFDSLFLLLDNKKRVPIFEVYPLWLFSNINLKSMSAVDYRKIDGYSYKIMSISGQLKK